MPNANGELVKRIDMFIHFAELAATNHITVKYTLDEPSQGAYRADPRTKTIVTRPIRNTGFYVSGLHEMGHIVGPDQGQRRNGVSLLKSEWGAWRWAKENAITWTDTAERVMKRALGGYTRGASGTTLEAMPADFWDWVDVANPIPVDNREEGASEV